MPVLDTIGRARTMAQWMRENLDTCAFGKPDLQAAVAAVDDWVEANQTSYNTALPQPFRSAATPAQKTALLAYVLWRRTGRLRAQEDG